jgi:hypothetical protein
VRARRGGAAALAALSLVFFALHLAYLPRSLEDLDSINFALGMRRFDVARHQPHPPGYPLFVLAAKAVHAFVRPEARALGLLSVVAATLGVIAIARLFRRLNGENGSLTAAVGTAIAVGSPLYWFTAVRPLSDATGLAAALGVQTLTVGAETPRALYLAAFCAGLACGIRSQVVWLTVPLVAFRLFGTRDRRVAVERAVGALAAFTSGALAWLVPLVVLSGGAAQYWRVLFSQGAEDLSGVRMLWTTPTLRQLLEALYYAFAAPWAVWPLAVVILLLAAGGVVVSLRRRPGALALVAVGFGPYLLFDLLFQETVTARYALPLVVPVAYLAAQGLSPLPVHPAVEAAAAIAVFSAHVGGLSIAAYARQDAPAFRLLADMDGTADRDQATAPVPAVAMDRREDFDLRRPLVWLDGSAPRFDRRLPAPPQHEWLEMVKFWNSGRRTPVWFVADPLRTDVQLVQHSAPAEYRWSVPYPALMSGTRPSEMDWYRILSPEWYVAGGWALTPEAAGVAESDGQGLAAGPIEGWVRADAGNGGTLVFGGRNFEPARRPRLTVTLEEAASRTVVQDLRVDGGPFLAVTRLPDPPPAAGRSSSSADYLRLSVAATPPSRVAIEQFDVSRDRPVFGFGAGWHEQEYSPARGVRWRWMSDRAELRVSAPRPFVLRLEGESPLRYFSRGSRLTVRAGGRIPFDAVLSSDFSLSIPIADAADVIALETDQTYVPADRGWRPTRDRRRLGLRIFRCELRPQAP